MRIRIFEQSGMGSKSIAELAERVNQWVKTEAIDAISIVPNMCAIGHKDTMYAHMTLTVIYRGN